MKHDGPGTAGALRADLTIGVTWAGGLRFEGGRDGQSRIRIDSKGIDGPSPTETLLVALAGCSSVDVVDILAKRRTPPASLDVRVVAERGDGTPRRITKVHLAYRISGAGIDRPNAERAISLAVTKYCSVRDTLDPAMPVTWSLELDETAG